MKVVHPLVLYLFYVDAKKVEVRSSIYIKHTPVAKDRRHIKTPKVLWVVIEVTIYLTYQNLHSCSIIFAPYCYIYNYNLTINALFIFKLALILLYSYSY